MFHFKDKGDPSPDVTLCPTPGDDGKARDRMASPLVLKPLALAEGKAIPLILRLKTPPLTAVELRRGNQALPLPFTPVIRQPELSKYSSAPLSRSPAGSALEAFLSLACENGFAEVLR